MKNTMKQSRNQDEKASASQNVRTFGAEELNEQRKLRGLTPLQYDDYTNRRLSMAQARQLEKRMGVRVWDGLLFDRSGISNVKLQILANDVGREIVAVPKQEAAQ